MADAQRGGGRGGDHGAATVDPYSGTTGAGLGSVEVDNSSTTDNGTSTEHTGNDTGGAYYAVYQGQATRIPASEPVGQGQGQGQAQGQLHRRGIRDEGAADHRPDPTGGHFDFRRRST
ncbi:hypothetical protein SOVF_065140 [Spinacia oleracea]|nr:hypothetical protein SOVF_065140 [Spinacia oleracea]